MTSTWTCPHCSRRFTRKNQRHACGTGERSDVLRKRPAEVVDLYSALETFATSLGPVEVVTRERYVLFRSRRVFADAIVMSDAVRLAIHLTREVEHRLFFKVVSDHRQVTHVARLHDLQDLEAMEPFLREAYEASLS
ncbi:DUF5655 domain-containing protein [Coralloluteibacterium stylophorae]|uniref:DUF5655 domain-containing protein n=1 Tax=Coralloluteibacterium stylophorae TaxID=1776034 RepID=A0A8J7VRT4_9GAMM|nr:DUF5655 domain-containing protein [Coralloluteibacterium stylophorae]MBS7457277.1 hypothetical protein [Coralloluteibacterium stylophorae]